MTDFKLCPNCNIPKPLDAFGKKQGNCKSCRNELKREKKIREGKGVRKKIIHTSTGKECVKCSIIKEFEDYYSASGNKDGKSSICKKCTQENQIEAILKGTRLPVKPYMWDTNDTL